MRKRLSYRRAKKGIAEQYSISINQYIVRSLGITESNRTIDLYYDRATKRVIIRKVEE